MLFWLIIAGLTLVVVLVLVLPVIGVARRNMGRSHILLLSLLTLGLPLTVLLLYQHWGDYDRVQRAQLVRQRITQVKKEIAQTGSRQALISQFKAHLKENGKSAKGWYLLGKLQLSDEKIQDAMASLKKAHELEPKNREYTIAYFRTLIHDKQHLPTKARQILESLHKENPNQPELLELLGIDAYNTKAYPKAIAYWEQLLSFYPADSPAGKQLLQLIADAQTRRMAQH